MLETQHTIFSFLGPSPFESLTHSLFQTSWRSYSELLKEHLEDFRATLHNKFRLNLGQKPDFTRPTDLLISNYRADVGDPYLEWLLFNFGRYLLVCSARGTLPANLQGIWAKDSSNPWNAGETSSFSLSSMLLNMTYMIAQITVCTFW